MKTVLFRMLVVTAAASAFLSPPASATSPVAPPAPTVEEMQVIRAIAAAQVDKNAARAEPVTIRKYVIGGRSYYYVPAPCCDRFNRLYTADGVYLCAPDGGATGGGDAQQKCPHIRLPGQPNWIVWRSPAPSTDGAQR